MSMIVAVICNQCGDDEQTAMDLSRKAARIAAQNRQRRGWVQIGDGPRREDYCPACAQETLHSPRTVWSLQ